MRRKWFCVLVYSYLHSQSLLCASRKWHVNVVIYFYVSVRLKTSVPIYVCPRQTTLSSRLCSFWSVHVSWHWAMLALKCGTCQTLHAFSALCDYSKFRIRTQEFDSRISYSILKKCWTVAEYVGLLEPASRGIECTLRADEALFFFFTRNCWVEQNSYSVAVYRNIQNSSLSPSLLSNFLFCFVFQILFYAGKHPTVIRYSKLAFIRKFLIDWKISMFAHP